VQPKIFHPAGRFFDVGPAGRCPYPRPSAYGSLTLLRFPALSRIENSPPPVHSPHIHEHAREGGFFGPRETIGLHPCPYHAPDEFVDSDQSNTVSATCFGQDRGVFSQLIQF
jgi:hypothetical protein